MSDWGFVPLVSIAASERSAISKPFGSAMVKEDYIASGIPVVRGVNLANGPFYDDDFVFISEELANRMPGAQLQPGDLVFTHRGTVGQVSMIPRSPRFPRYAVSTSQVKARLDQSVALPEFYYYWFRSAEGRRSIHERISTVGVPGLAQPVATVKSLRVPLPPLDEQHAIAGVLGALDDKIAANAALAASADEVAKSEFSATLASVPTAKVRLSDIARVVLGGTPSRAVPDFWAEGTVPWLNSGAANATRVVASSELITEDALARSAAKMMPVGATLVAITGATLGQVARLEIAASGNQSLIGVWSEDAATNDWLYFAIQHRIDDLLTRATGAAQQHVSKGDVGELLIPLPPELNRDRFARFASPLLQVAANAELENLAVAAIRDTLLPQLMSGKLRVRDAEHIASEAGA
jgi:type I restriction enzyme S subunit